MNREIKFRAWDKSQNRMLSVCEPHEQGKREYYPFEVQIGFSHWNKEDIILMQYTGLKDKNNVEIYEDDVIKTPYGIGRIVFDNGCFMIEWTDDKEAMLELLAYEPNNYRYGRARTDFEVIGNVHQNVHLIT